MFFSTKRVLSGLVVLLTAANYASAGTVLPRDNPPQPFGTFFDAALDDQAGLNDPDRPKFEVKALAQCLDLGPAAKKMSSARLNPGVSCLLYLVSCNDPVTLMISGEVRDLKPFGDIWTNGFSFIKCFG